jgi:hypothetical protein
VREEGRGGERGGEGGSGSGRRTKKKEVNSGEDK